MILKIKKITRQEIILYVVTRALNPICNYSVKDIGKVKYSFIKICSYEFLLYQSRIKCYIHQLLKK